MEKLFYCQHTGFTWILPPFLKKIQVKRNATECAKQEKICGDQTHEEPYQDTEMPCNLTKSHSKPTFHVANKESAW